MARPPVAALLKFHGKFFLAIAGGKLPPVGEWHIVIAAQTPKVPDMPRIGLLLAGFGLACIALCGCNGKSDSDGKLSYREQAARARAEKDPVFRAKQLTAIGYRQGKAKDISGSAETLRMAGEACEAIPDAALRSAAWVLLAKVYDGLNSGPKAREATGSSLAAAEKIESAERKASAFAKAAEAQNLTADKAAAKKTLEKAEEIAGSVADPQGKTLALCTVAESYWRIEEPKQCNRVLAATLKFADSVEDMKKRCPVLGAIAVRQAEIKQKDAAAKTFEAGLEAARRIEDQYAKTYAMGELAEQLSAAGFRAKSHEVLAEAESEAEKIPQPDMQRMAMEKIRSLMGKLPGP